MQKAEPAAEAKRSRFEAGPPGEVRLPQLFRLATLEKLTLATGQRDAHRLTSDSEDGTETTRLPQQKNDEGSRIGNGCRVSRSRGGRTGIDF